MNRKGQALIEFVLILPIFLLILFVIFDFGNIFYSKYELQNQSADIVRLIQNGSSDTDIKEINSKLNINISEYKDNYKKIVLSKKVMIITPGLNKILGNPYIVDVERIVFNDESQ